MKASGKIILGCLAVPLALVALLAFGLMAAILLEPETKIVERNGLLRPEAGGFPPATLELATPDSRRRLSLELSQGDFRVLPAAAGEPLRFEAEFDEGRFDLVKNHEALGPGHERLEIRFVRKNKGLLGLLAALVGPGASNRLTIFLPRDEAIALDLETTKGNASLEMGGLPLTRLSYTGSQGNFELSFSSPNPLPMSSLDVRLDKGNFELQGLGNASAERILVNASMGNHDIDFGGAWKTSTDAEIRLRYGNSEIRLPRDLQVAVVEVSSGTGGHIELPPQIGTELPQDPEIDGGTGSLTLRISASFGNVGVY